MDRSPRRRDASPTLAVAGPPTRTIGRVPRRLTVAIAALILVVAFGGLLWWRLGARDASSVGEDTSVETLRARGGGTGDPAAGIPEPGVYTYRQDGWERGGVGPIAVRRDLPGEARAIVAEADEDGYLLELALAAQHVEAVRVRIDGAWIRSTWRRTDVTIAGVGRDDRRALTPPPRWIPRSPAVGQRWRDRFMVGPLPVDATSEVRGRGEVIVDGRTFDTFEVEVVSRTGGSFPGTRTERIWWSTALALPVRWRIDSDTGGVAFLTTVTDLRLVSARPVR